MVRPIKDKKEPLLVNEEPEGNNGMTSRAIFYQRKLYDRKVFTDPLAPKEPIDLWYERLFYGREDAFSNAVHLSEVNLKRIPGLKKDFYALNFVVDAFVELRDYVRNIANRGLLNPARSDDPYVIVEPKKAWESVHSLYGAYMEGNYLSFNNFFSYIPKDKRDKMLTFEDYISVFEQYVDAVVYGMPFTRTRYLKTKASDPKISGLVIELSEDLHSDDKNKYENYILNDNFVFFKRVTERYGFKLDKNAPWRLIADLKSPAMKSYMAEYEVVDLDDFFKKYYYTSYKVEFDSMKTYITQFYNSLVAANPKANFVQSKLCQRGPVLETKFLSREPISEKELDMKYGVSFWLRMYAFIRARERNKSWNQEKFEVVVRKAKEFEIGVDLEFAIDYIERQVQVEEPGKPNRNFSLRPF